MGLPGTWYLSYLIQWLLPQPTPSHLSYIIPQLRFSTNALTKLKCIFELVDIFKLVAISEKVNAFEIIQISKIVEKSDVFLLSEKGTKIIQES